MAESRTFVSIPIPTDQFRALCFFLDSYSSTEDPVEVVSKAIDRWIDQAEADEDVLRPSQRGRGYRWKEVFLPDGTEVRFKYDGTYHYANVLGDEFLWQDQPTSPSQFVVRVAGSVRNAWRDLEVKRPGRDWELADAIRRKRA